MLVANDISSIIKFSHSGLNIKVFILAGFDRNFSCLLQSHSEFNQLSVCFFVAPVSQSFFGFYCRVPISDSLYVLSVIRLFPVIIQ